MRWFPLCGALLGACGADPARETDDGATGPDTDTPIVDTGPTSEPTEEVPPPLSAIEARLNETVGTVVIVGWEQAIAGDVRVEFSFEDDRWLGSPTRALDPGPHEELLLGIPFDADVTFRIVLDDGSAVHTSEEATIRTAPPPAALPQATLLTSDPSRYDPDAAWFVTSMKGVGAVPTFTVVLDREGRTVWARPTPQDYVTWQPKIAWDGRSLLVDHNSFWGSFDGGADSSIHRVLIDGSEVEAWNTPGLHHPFTHLPDGTLAYGRLVGADEVVQLVRPDGTPEELWSCAAWLASIGAGGSCASNTLTYDAAGDRFLFSFYSLETIVEIDAASGQATKWFGHVDGAYAFDPPQSAFWWQHGGNYTAAGTLLTSTHRAPDGGEILAREYEVDDPARTLREIYTLGEGTGVVGPYMGEAHRLANGNTLHNTGSDCRLREGTPDGEIVWEVRWTTGNELGRSVPLADLYALAPERL